MVSLTEARQQMETLELQVESTKMSYHDLRIVEMSIIRIGNALEKMTGSKEVSQAINTLNRLIFTVRSLQIAMHALDIAAGPIGWLYAAATIIGFGVMVGETAMELTS